MAHDFTSARTAPNGKLKWLAKSLARGVSSLAELPPIIASDRISGLYSRMLAFGGLTRIRLYRPSRMFQLMAGMDPDSLSGRWNWFRNRARLFQRIYRTP